MKVGAEPLAATRSITSLTARSLSKLRVFLMVSAQHVLEFIKAFVLCFFSSNQITCKNLIRQ